MTTKDKDPIFCSEFCVMDAYSWQLSAEPVEIQETPRYCAECDAQILPYNTAFLAEGIRPRFTVISIN